MHPLLGGGPLYFQAKGPWESKVYFSYEKNQEMTTHYSNWSHYFLTDITMGSFNICCAFESKIKENGKKVYIWVF